MSAPDGQVTLLLTELREGKQDAANRLAGWPAPTCSANGPVTLGCRSSTDYPAASTDPPAPSWSKTEEGHRASR
jgi:hypothetical protein